MNETRRLAASIGGKVGVAPELIVAVLLALLQAMPSFLALCKPPAMTPAETLKWAAQNHPFAVRMRTRWACRSEGVPPERVVDVQHELLHTIHTEPVETLAAVCSESLGK